MFWYKLPHPENLYHLVEDLAPQTRWVCTVLFFLLAGLTWYYGAYTPLERILEIYKNDIEQGEYNIKQLSSYPALYEKLQAESSNISNKLSNLKHTTLGYTQPCIWLHSLVVARGMQLQHCTCEQHNQIQQVSCTIAGNISQIKQLIDQIIQKYSGWQLDSLMIKQAENKNAQAHHVYTAHITIKRITTITDSTTDTTVEAVDDAKNPSTDTAEGLGGKR